MTHPIHEKSRGSKLSVVYLCLINSLIFNYLSNTKMLVFFLVEEKVVFCRIVRPDVLNTFVNLAVILKLFEILHNFQRSSGTGSIVYQFLLGGWPWSILQPIRKFKCPVHGKIKLNN